MKAGTGACVTFDVDLDAYTMEAVYGASYIFLDRYYLSMERPSKKALRVTIRPKDGGATDPVAIEGAFKNELLNQALRETIAARNAKLREYIIGRALYGAETAADAGAKGYTDDPLGIAVPWEQKYGPAGAPADRGKK
jgi:His-Xaa-Ser system protein HxsD